MEIKVGEILEGKVKSIAKFGAFIALADGKTGLVHISEVANSFVNDIHEHLTEGQDVKVKVLSMDENGRINLSIKQTQEKPQRSSPAPRGSFQRSRNDGAPAKRSQHAPAPQERSAEQTFEEKLKAFMTESDSKIAGLKQYSNQRPRPRRR